MKTIHTAKLRTLFSFWLLLLLLCVACSTPQATEPEGTTDEAAQIEASTEDQTETPTEDQTEVPADLEIADEWVQSVFEESMQKLGVEAGVVFDPDTKPPFVSGFDADRGNIPFLQGADAIDRYIDTPVSIHGKIIVADCTFSARNGYAALSNWGIGSADPCFYYYDLGIDPICFADSIDECDILMCYGGYETRRDENYYAGDTDRISTTTLVFVIDAKSRELLHIESIGTDTPGSTTSNPYGLRMEDEAFEYINSIVEA